MSTDVCTISKAPGSPRHSATAVSRPLSGKIQKKPTTEHGHTNSFPCLNFRFLELGNTTSRAYSPPKARCAWAMAARGALCSCHKSCRRHPWGALLHDTKRGFVKGDLACVVAARGWWGAKPSAVARRQSLQPGVSAGCEMGAEDNSFLGTCGKRPGQAIVHSDLLFSLC